LAASAANSFSVFGAGAGSVAVFSAGTAAASGVCAANGAAIISSALKAVAVRNVDFMMTVLR
jgi:hypothetical protein